MILFYHLPNLVYQPTWHIHCTSCPSTNCSILTIMPTKHQHKQLKSARTASFEVFKKKRLEVNSFSNSAQLKVDNYKLSTTNITNTKSESGTWFWNKSTNETDLDTKKEKNGNHKKDLESDEFRVKEVVSSEIHKVETKWSRKKHNKLGEGYGKESKKTQITPQKLAWELEKEASKIYDI